MQNPDILNQLPASITEPSFILASGIALSAAGITLNWINEWRQSHPKWPFKREPVSLEVPPFKTTVPTFDRKNTRALLTATSILSEPVESRRLIAYDFDERLDVQENRYNSQIKGLNFKQIPLMLAAIHRSSGTTEYFGAFISLVDGTDINKLLLSNATYKGLGLDTQDILDDWEAIDKATKQMANLKTRHTGLGLAWDVLARDRDLIGFMIGRDRQPKSPRLREEPKPMMLAVLRWENDGLNGRRFLYDLPTDEINQRLLKAFLEPTPDYLPHLPKPQCYNPTVGIWVLAHLSPEVKENWRPQYGFRQEDKSRSNGSTQSGVQTLRFDSPQPRWYRSKDGLLRGKFIKNAEDYINEHGIPFESS